MMGRFRTSGRQLHALFALLILLSTFASPVALAVEQSEPAEAQIVVTAFNCLVDPGNVSVTMNNIPPDCTPLVGVTMTIQAEVPDDSGTCLTNEHGACTALVTDESMVTVIQDTSLLSGTAPRMNPISVSTVWHGTEFTFINLPIATAVPDTAPVADEPPAPMARTAQQPASLDTFETASTLEDEGDTEPDGTNDPPLTSNNEQSNGDEGNGDGTEPPVVTPSETPVTPVSTTPASTVTPSPEVTVTPVATTPVATQTPSPSPTPETKTYATVSGTGGAGLRCRADANTSATIITVLAEGTKVETRGAASNGWIPVTCAGQAGWIYASYATVSSAPAPSNPTPAPTQVPTDPGSGIIGSGTVSNTGGGGLNCRVQPSLTASIITVLPAGAIVEVRGATTNGWVPVKCANQNGWVSSSYLVIKTSTGSNPTPAPTPTPTTGTTTYAMVSGTGYGGLNCRVSPSLTAQVIMILPEGTRVETRGSASNGWVPIICGGQNGWASASYLLLGVGAGSGTGAVWIDVDLTRQYVKVYRGSTLIGETYASTGRYGFDTPPGTFYVNWKLPSQTMTGVLGGEYYYVENVPWVMYFTNRGHAIHGAYWHNNFGYRMSHGCVNLPVPFSKWLYEISPIGTRVYIHF